MYCAEEPGCAIYINSDTSGLFFEDKYLVEWIDEGDCEYLATDNGLLNIAKELGFESKNIKEVLKWFGERDDVVVRVFERD